MSLDSGVVIEIDSPSAFDCSVSSRLSSPSPQPTPGWVTRKAQMDLLPLHIAYLPLVQGLQSWSHPLSSSAMCPPGCGGQIWEDQKDPLKGRRDRSHITVNSPPISLFQCYFYILLVLSGDWHQLLSAISLVPHLRTPSANPPQAGYPSANPPQAGYPSKILPFTYWKPFQCGVLTVRLQQKQGQNIAILISAFT